MKASELALRLTEAEFQQKITDRAEALSWLVYHTHDSRRSNAGFPDLFLCRGDRVVAFEVKSEHGRVSDAQNVWLNALGITKVETWLVRPSDWAFIEKVLA